MRMRRSPALLAVLALPVMSCGSDDAASKSKTDGGPAGAALKISADPGGALRFDQGELSAKAGTVTIEMANPSAVPHAVAIRGEDLDEQGETVGKGGVSTVSADLDPGTYSFYCPVGSHDAAGMRGALLVR